MKIISPLKIEIPRKTMKNKEYILNLNNYRNWHYIVSNQIKDAYTFAMGKQLSGLRFKKIKIILKYFKGTERKCDRANIYCIHEKFFCDALVCHGVIEDDNDDFIKESVYLAVELDKVNPRVEIEIQEV